MGSPVRDVQERRTLPALISPLAIAVAAIAVAVDHAVKWWALNELDDRNIDLIGSFRLNLVMNDGGAFGVGGRYGFIFGIAAIVAVLFLVRAGGAFASRRSQVGVGLVLAGALGNLLDRIFREGNGFLGGDVVDLFDLQWWPVFNVADVCLYVGAGLLVLFADRAREPEHA